MHREFRWASPAWPALAVSLVAFVSSPASFAQSTPASSELDEVVVTAERREQVLDMLVRRSRELKSALDGLVRGLPPEVLELLDSLNPPAITLP